MVMAWTNSVQCQEEELASRIIYIPGRRTAANLMFCLSLEFGVVLFKPWMDFLAKGMKYSNNGAEILLLLEENSLSQLMEMVVAILPKPDKPIKWAGVPSIW